ncbi:unnamed protein product, partial [marine sediment metagenome]
RAEHLEKQVKQVKEGTFDGPLSKLKKMNTQSLKKLYVEREAEPAMADEFWEPTTQQPTSGKEVGRSV